MNRSPHCLLALVAIALPSISFGQAYLNFLELSAPLFDERDVAWSGPGVDLDPIDTSSGVGSILDESIGGYGFHSHQYDVPHVPTEAVLTFGFSQEVTVEGVTIGQHGNGVTQIETFVGDDLGAMVSMGTTFGPKGDIVSGGGVTLAAEREQHLFDLSTTDSGTFFQFRITKTYLSNGYAGYNVALDFTPLSVVPEPSVFATLAGVWVAVFLLGGRRRRS